LSPEPSSPPLPDARRLLRELPSVDRLLTHEQTRHWLARFGREYVTRQVREALDDLRRDITRGADVSAASILDGAVLARVGERIRRDGTIGPQRVVNATGTILHTNLGRAPLASAAVEAVARVAAGPSTLEYDLVRGARGRRESEVARRLTWLTGAEAATVVNNNAAAVLVAVNTLSAGKEVIVSRGELVEIGGAFRIPDIVAKSGATLREVGTTNRTHRSDYERAIGPNTGLLLKVHTSNYRIVGFSADVSLTDLVDVGRLREIPVMEDLGSGALVDLSRYGLPKEPVVSDRVAMGADLVTFSGDKLLGGPQAGLITGRRRSIDAIAENPLHRALRCDKMTLAALEATLALYQQSEKPERDIPTLALLTRSLDDIASVGQQAVPLVQRALGEGFRVHLEDDVSQVGSGALPTAELPTKVVVVLHGDLPPDRIAERFRSANPPIIGRIRDGRFLLDLRTVAIAQDLVPGA
jgi:L-seryl-tRNA(Ser) seleniumtransferase